MSSNAAVANGRDAIRIVRSQAALDALLDRIEAGLPRPDWIHLQGDAHLEARPLAHWPALLGRLHRATRRGFRCAPLSTAKRARFLERWRCIAAHGFHDFGEHGHRKCYDSPFVESYDYLGPYVDGGLDALDPYAVYGAVLGSHDFGVEEFLRTEALADVRTVVEPMAGTAEFAYQGHFRFPEFRYLMIDLDPAAASRVLARRWLPETERHYFVANALDEEVWKQVKATSSGPSFAFIGKQSHQLFDVRQLVGLLELGTLYADAIVLETPPMTLVTDLAAEEDLTRPEMEAAGLEVKLVDLPGRAPNPFTNRTGFRLEASDATGTRTLFDYAGWTVWAQPTLVALAELSGLETLYYHSELEEFVPADHDATGSDCVDNVSFMLFRRGGSR
ncbi:MAG: hypothetical protein R3E88_02905 [Myxococcota bacterium]|nr:hypothetical protein [Myxococcales bacterium]